MEMALPARGHIRGQEGRTMGGHGATGRSGGFWVLILAGALMLLAAGWLFGWAVCIAALILLLVPRLAVWITRQTVYREKPILTDRALISKEELFNSYYRDSGIPAETVFECLSHIANSMEIPMGAIRPSDRFESEYSPLPGDGLLELGWFLADRRKEAGVDEIEELPTVDAFIRYVDRLKKAKRPDSRTKQ